MRPRTALRPLGEGREAGLRLVERPPSGTLADGTQTSERLPGTRAEVGWAEAGRDGVMVVDRRLVDDPSELLEARAVARSRPGRVGKEHAHQHAVDSTRCDVATSQPRSWRNRRSTLVHSSLTARPHAAGRPLVEDSCREPIALVVSQRLSEHLESGANQPGAARRPRLPRLR
jgi:hypothetical protein